MASPAPTKQNSPRHTSHEPANIDHNVMPTASRAPRPIKAQGLDSYRDFGVQERMAVILQPQLALRVWFTILL